MRRSTQATKGKGSFCSATVQNYTTEGIECVTSRRERWTDAKIWREDDGASRFVLRAVTLPKGLEGSDREFLAAGLLSWVTTSVRNVDDVMAGAGESSVGAGTHASMNGRRGPPRTCRCFSMVPAESNREEG